MTLDAISSITSTNTAKIILNRTSQTEPTVGGTFHTGYDIYFWRDPLDHPKYNGLRGNISSLMYSGTIFRCE